MYFLVFWDVLYLSIIVYSSFLLVYISSCFCDYNMQWMNNYNNNNNNNNNNNSAALIVARHTLRLTSWITAQHWVGLRKVSEVKSWWRGPTGSHPVSGFGRQLNGRRHSGHSGLPSSSLSDDCNLVFMYSSRHPTQKMCWHGRTLGVWGMLRHIAHWRGKSLFLSPILRWKHDKRQKRHDN